MSTQLVLPWCSHCGLREWGQVEALYHHLLSQLYYETQTNSSERASKILPYLSHQAMAFLASELSLCGQTLQRADSHLGYTLASQQAGCHPDSDQIFLLWLDAIEWVSAHFHQRLASLPLVVVVMEVWTYLDAGGYSLYWGQGVV